MWLEDGSNAVGVAVIYGMGGIGKTTIAKAAYNRNFGRFQGSSFLADIREAAEQPYGFVRLQRKLLSDIQKGKAKKIDNIDEGIIKIKHAVCNKRLPIVLDDVNDLDQFNAILGMREWFYPGSKIIITTRHEHLLKAHEGCTMFEVEELNEYESLELFSWHAFGQPQPIEGYMELSRPAVEHCGVIPLALQVLGSSLSGKEVDVWHSALQKLCEIPNVKIQKILRISYDSLRDDHDKNIFLHIAYFFIGKEKDTGTERMRYISIGNLVLSIVEPANPNVKIRGLNACVLYARRPDHKGDERVASEHFVKVSNETKGRMWTYSPVAMALPRENQDMLWLSHWIFGDDELEGGEELRISVKSGLWAKEFAIQLVHEEENKGKGVGSHGEDIVTLPWNQNVVKAGDVPGSVSASKSEM
ncbi:TMV resistance protein N-like [Prunus avium]|uniref:TMV resistance protein N-like n=1 Tax=Prunus avium TaxID=42229 RepID=A0A6P5TKB2_PRUAV|nr:TMV resistance protein N-like [Prunus avium]